MIMQNFVGRTESIIVFFEKRPIAVTFSYKNKKKIRNLVQQKNEAKTSLQWPIYL